MKTITKLLLLLVLFTACKKQKRELSAIEILEKTKEFYEGQQSMSYDIVWKQRYSSGEDTIISKGSCILEREKEDTIFGGYVWIENTAGGGRYYDLELIYYINDFKKGCVTYKAHEGEEFGMQGNVTGSFKDVYFLDNYRFQKSIDDSTLEITKTDTSIDNISYWVIKINAPDEEPYLSDIRYEIYIIKDKFIVTKRCFWVKLQGNLQYTEWELNNIEFNNKNKDTILKLFDEKIKDYKVITYEPPSEEESKPLDNGTIAPNFKGSIYETEEEVNLKDYRGKVVLLDFWYMSCFPCKVAMPHLNELYQNHKDDGLVVLGLNPHNNNEKDLKRMPDFIEKNSLHYPIVFIEKDVVNDYNVHGFPTLYVIDKEGKIVHSEIGFGKEISKEMDSVLKVLLE